MTQVSPLESFMLSRRAERLEQAAARRTRNLTLVLDGVHDPRNLSAIVRSSEAFGLLDLFVIESHGRFQVNGKISKGTDKWLDIHRFPDAAASLRELCARGYDLWVADPRPGSRRVDDLPWEGRIALVFGNEHDGASAELQRAARGAFHLPMYGFAESFNVSVAAGITLGVAVRERERRLGRHGDLPEAERQRLVAEWQRRSVKHAEKILRRLALVKGGHDAHSEGQ